MTFRRPDERSVTAALDTKESNQKHAGFSTLHSLGILAGSYLLLHLPFLGQPFVIDDGNFVDQALHILRHPFDPYSFEIHLDRVHDFFEYFANPPGFAYYLAAFIRFFGHSEWVLHAACLPFSAAAVAAMYGLSRLFAGCGLFCALLFLFTPVFLVSSHTVMADVPAAACFLAALLAFVRGVDEDRKWLLIGSGLAAGLAALFKYSSLTVIPLMLLYAGARREVRSKTLAAPLLGAAIFGAWCAASWGIYGELHILAAAGVQGSTKDLASQAVQGVAALASIGGATLFPIALLAWALSAAFALTKTGGYCATAAAVAAFASVLPDYGVFSLTYGPGNRLLLGLLVAAGVSAVSFALLCGVDAVRELAKYGLDEAETLRIPPARTLLLVAWFLGFVLLDARMLFATPKYLVPAAAPLILLLVGSAPRTRPVIDGMGRGMGQAVLASTLVLAIALSVASAAQGRSHRSFIREALPELAVRERGSELQSAPRAVVWFNGHWTIRYYAENAGHNYLGPQLERRPRAGDLFFVVDDAVMHDIPAPISNRLTLIDTRSFASPLPLLIANVRVRAGYWSHLLGALPYVISTEATSVVRTFRIGKPKRGAR